MSRKSIGHFCPPVGKSYKVAFSNEKFLMQKCTEPIPAMQLIKTYASYHLKNCPGQHAAIIHKIFNFTNRHFLYSPII